MSALRMDQLREILRPHNAGIRVIKRRLASRLLKTRPDWAALDPFTTERIMLVSSSDIHGLVGMKEAIDKLGLHDRIFVVAAVIAGDLVSPEQIQSFVSCGSVGGAYASLLSMGVSVITGFLRLVETLLEKGTEMSSMNLSEKIKSASTQDKKVREFLELFSELSIKQLLEAKECFEEATGIKAAAVAVASPTAAGPAAPAEEVAPTVVITEILNALAFAKVHKKLLDDGKIKGENQNLVTLAKDAKAAIESKQPVTFEAKDAKDLDMIKKSLAEVATFK